ncbi:PAS domain-containing protein [candidate division KSB1 bacterium]|nr:PAS domain-containing protein [candidate division KSB1 bacterium]
MISKKINVLAVGFNYQEINYIQDELGKEFVHFHFDFAISIRDSWYRLKFKDYDFLLIDLSDSELNTIIATQEIVQSINDVSVIVSVRQEHMKTISSALNIRPSHYSIKDHDFAVNLVDIIKADVSNPKRTYKSIGKKKFDNVNSLHIMDAINERMMVVDTDYNIRLMNKAMAAAMKRDANEMIGHSCYKVSYDFDEPCHEKGLKCPLLELKQKREVSKITHIHKSSHTEHIKRISVKAVPLNNDDDLTNLVLLTVSCQKVAQHETVMDNQLLEALINGVSDGIFMCDENGVIIAHNHIIDKLFGKERHFFVGKSILDIPVEEASHWLGGILQNANTQIHTTSNLKIQIKNKWLLLRYVPLYHENDSYLGGFLFLSDISTSQVMDAHFQEIDRELFKITKYFPTKFIAEG